MVLPSRRTQKASSSTIANAIEGDKKVPALLSEIGPKPYALLKTLVAPAKPSTKTLASVRRPRTLISIWTFVICVRGLLSPSSNMRARATLRGVMLLLRISTHKNVLAFVDRAPSPDE